MNNLFLRKGNKVIGFITVVCMGLWLVWSSSNVVSANQGAGKTLVVLIGGVGDIKKTGLMLSLKEAVDNGVYPKATDCTTVLYGWTQGNIASKKIREFRKMYPKSNQIIVGHSAGGYTSMVVAGLTRPKRLITLDPYKPPPSSVIGYASGSGFINVAQSFLYNLLEYAVNLPLRCIFSQCFPKFTRTYWTHVDAEYSRSCNGSSTTQVVLTAGLAQGAYPIGAYYAPRDIRNPDYHSS